MAAFKSDHDMVAPTQRMDGIAWYTILATEHGCVTGYSIDMYTTPPSGASDMVFLTDGIYLPEDIQRVVDEANCTVYTSPTLRKASGYKFAVATGTAQSGGAPGHAEIDLTNDGSCVP